MSGGSGLRSGCWLRKIASTKCDARDVNRNVRLM